MQVLLGRDGGRLAKVDAAPLAQDGLAVPVLAHGDGVGVAVEGDDDAVQGLERREGVDAGLLRDEVADALEVVGGEDVARLEVGEDERVAGWCRLGERRQAGEVEGQGGRHARARAAARRGARQRGLQFW